MARFIFPVVFVVFLVACTPQRAGVKAPASDGHSAEDVIAQRAVERWQYIIAGDFGAAYDYLTRGAKSVVSRDEYARRLAQAQVKWTGVGPIKVECEDEAACRVEVELDIQVQVPRAGEIVTKTYVQEDWLLDGKDLRWHYLPGQAR